MGGGLTCVAVKKFFSNAKHLKKQKETTLVFLEIVAEVLKGEISLMSTQFSFK